MGTTAASSRQSAVSRCRPCTGQADGLIRLSGRIPAGGDTQSIIMSPGQNHAPRAKVRLAAPGPAPRLPRLITRTERPRARTAEPDPRHHRSLPPAAWHDPLPGRPRQRRLRRRYAGAARPLTRPPARRIRQLSRDREQTQASPDQGDHDSETPKSNPCGHRRMQVGRFYMRPSRRVATLRDRWHSPAWLVQGHPGPIGADDGNCERCEQRAEATGKRGRALRDGHGGSARSEPH